jgi:hypothetical protein
MHVLAVADSLRRALGNVLGLFELGSTEWSYRNIACGTLHREIK